MGNGNIFLHGVMLLTENDNEHEFILIYTFRAITNCYFFAFVDIKISHSKYYVVMCCSCLFINACI